MGGRDYGGGINPIDDRAIYCIEKQTELHKRSIYLQVGTNHDLARDLSKFPGFTVFVVLWGLTPL